MQPWLTTMPTRRRLRRLWLPTLTRLSVWSASTVTTSGVTCDTPPVPGRRLDGSGPGASTPRTGRRCRHCPRCRDHPQGAVSKVVTNLDDAPKFGGYQMQLEDYFDFLAPDD